jgi:non-canonical purine NTP pyrophosphatase (RdgB/HAM1 family)
MLYIKNKNDRIIRMKIITFITGNQNKADYLEKYLGCPVEHIKIDLDEIQSLDLKDVVQHKLRQAFKQINKPVLVEDVSLEFNDLGKLPGTYIKWFMGEMNFEDLCRLVDGKTRKATARCMFGYHDGENEHYFEGSLEGIIPEHPAGTGGYG